MTGNPSINPVVFRPATQLKLMVTGYLENITLNRRLIEHLSNITTIWKKNAKLI